MEKTALQDTPSRSSISPSWPGIGNSMMPLWLLHIWQRRIPVSSSLCWDIHPRRRTTRRTKSWIDGTLMTVTRREHAPFCIILQYVECLLCVIYFYFYLRFIYFHLDSFLIIHWLFFFSFYIYSDHINVVWSYHSQALYIFLFALFTLLWWIIFKNDSKMLTYLSFRFCDYSYSYSFGLALICEGFGSLIYHICPSQIIFQVGFEFDNVQKINKFCDYYTVLYMSHNPYSTIKRSVVTHMCAHRSINRAVEK